VLHRTPVRLAFACAAAVALALTMGACSRKPPVEPLTLAGNLLTSDNRTKDDWTGVDIWLNRNHRVMVAKIAAGGRLQVPLDAFVAGFGQRFDVRRTQVTDVRLTAKLPDGTPLELQMPFREGGLVQVMNGNIDFYFIPLAAAATALHSDKLTVLAVSAPKRVPILPNVPSVVEAGYPGAVFRFWNGISAPAKTPPAVVQKFHDVTEQALKMPTVQEKLAKLGVEPAQISSAEFATFFKEDFAATVELAKKAGIKPVD
jgi:hypothetical protein